MLRERENSTSVSYHIHDDRNNPNVTKFDTFVSVGFCFGQLNLMFDNMDQVRKFVKSIQKQIKIIEKQ